ncbi:MAG TPA: hypothetical protein VES01_02675, partial [Dermatophilaceae bacterium]|nr:hypothetical protein [Dermatophilaceae bacterium]
HAFLTVTALSARADPDHDALVPITRNEIRHLLVRALAKPLTWAFTLSGRTGDAPTNPDKTPGPGPVRHDHEVTQQCQMAGIHTRIDAST